MKLKTLLPIITFCILSCYFVKAENASTMYFMDEIAERNNMNPAFMPNCKFYFDFVALPNFYISAGTNQLTLNDLIFNKNGRTLTFLNSEESTDKFIRSLKPSTTLNVNFNLNILSFGFQIKQRHYLTFDMGINADVSAYIPKDIFRFALYGTPDPDNVNTFHLDKLGIDANVYTNVGLGYMNRISERWTVGAKVKFLMGYANISTDIKDLRLDASRENWTLKTAGQINASLPIYYQNTQEGGIDLNTISLQSQSDLISLLYKPAGMGAAFDLGFTYKPLKELTISGAITDLGFITYNRNTVAGSINGEHSIDELINYQPGDSLDIKAITDKLIGLGEDILGTMQTEGNTGKYTSMIYANFTVGAEYGILKNKISFGAVNRLRFNNNHVRDEVTIAANFRPADWFKAAISYSFINGRGGNIGLGLNLRAGMFNTYIIFDYIPVSYAYLRSESQNINISVPNRTQCFNIQAGWTWNLGRHSNDRDNDGVKKLHDRCPDTDMDFLRKQCPGLKKKQLVDRHGCEFDEDHDGIHDCYDRCPDTPAGVEVDSVGCPVDTDRDGIADYLDRCPDTPYGVEVDTNGCPVDADGDGIPDYLDKCPDTPQNVLVDENGCPVDSDGDGIADYLDRCPDTPKGVEVDEHGCPIDSDMDGVPDYLDKCPDTPEGAAVDTDGCPIDSDGDGIPDYLDKCPNQAGPKSNQGCPEITKEVRSLFTKAMTGIQFETGKDIIKKSSYPILDKIVAVMEFNPEYNLSISGYTDNVGNSKNNLRISEKRAAAVRAYMIKKGIDPKRITSKGYGESNPIADNKTAKGRAQNRRVEFEISFEKITVEKVRNQE